MDIKYIVFAFELMFSIAVYIFLKHVLGLAAAELFMLVTYSLALLSSIDTAAGSANDAGNSNEAKKEESKDEEDIGKKQG